MIKYMENNKLEEQQKVIINESISLLSGGIAHDLNNILTLILGHISLAKEAGFSPRPNTKTNVGLGRPQIEEV